MKAATYLLFIIGVLGAADILLFHTLAHRIRHNHDSRLELKIHTLRGPTYGLLFLLIPNFAMRGIFYWAFIGLLIADISISIWDFSIESTSRKKYGGLPAGEYVLHAIMAMFFGAMVACIITGTWSWGSMPARFVMEPPEVPLVLRGIMVIMSIMVVISGLQDALAAHRLGRE